MKKVHARSRFEERQKLPMKKRLLGMAWVQAVWEKKKEDGG